MSGPKRNPDKLNTIGIVVVGICGAVLVYVSIVALQAFYMDDTSEIQHMADYGGQDTMYKSLRAQQLDNIKTYAPKAAPVAKEGQPTPPQTYTIGIDDAIKLVVEGAKTDPSNLVPAIGPAVTPSVLPIFGRPKLIPTPAPAPAPGTGSAAPADGAGAGSSAPMVPTGGEGPAATTAGTNPPAAAPATPAPNTPAPPTPATQTQPKATPAPATQTQPKATPAPAPAAPAQPKKGNAS